MHAKILGEVSADPYYKTFANDGQRFIAWYLRNVWDYDANEVAHAMTDGANDNEIDAVMIDNEASKIVIVQGKFLEASTVDAGPLQEVLSAWAKLKSPAGRIELQAKCNPKLAVKLQEIASALDDDYDVEFELLTTGNLTPAAQGDLGIFQEQLASSDDLQASLIFVGPDELQRRYDESRAKLKEPVVNHSLTLPEGQFLTMDLQGTKIVMAAVPLPECLKFPGIKDGTLFRKNVRQSLGISNKVNKGIKSTLYGDRAGDFFFFHNGITAICDSLSFDEETRTLKLNGLSVVNGCQSLTTLVHCSEKVKQQGDSCMMFRFYEIPQRERGDRISINTNSQSTVKPRDLRANDKRVLALKKAYDARYPQGTFLIKRGEAAPASADPNYVVEMSSMAKALMAWHCQRPTISYNENKLFDKYFEQLFKLDYAPENAFHLMRWLRLCETGWNSANAFGINESLLAMKSYAIFHHLFAIAAFFARASNLPERVPSPQASWVQASTNGQSQAIAQLAAQSLNFALETAKGETPEGKVFSPQNWLKAKASLNGITQAAAMQMMMMGSMPGGKALKDALTLPGTDFDSRWSAD